jgi:hypothetical protein
VWGVGGLLEAVLSVQITYPRLLGEVGDIISLTTGHNKNILIVIYQSDEIGVRRHKHYNDRDRY